MHGNCPKIIYDITFAPLFCTNPTCHGLGLNPGLRGNRPANNLVSDGTAPGLFECGAEERIYTF
jgi:hypothetical protein